MLQGASVGSKHIHHVLGVPLPLYRFLCSTVRTADATQPRTRGPITRSGPVGKQELEKTHGIRSRSRYTGHQLDLFCGRATRASRTWHQAAGEGPRPLRGFKLVSPSKTRELGSNSSGGCRTSSLVLSQQLRFMLGGFWFLLW